jgi:hypothetical protein
MNIKSFMALAVAALTVAACSAEPEAVEVPVNEDAAATVDLNDNGTPADAAEGPAAQAELESGEVSPREVSEGNPAFKPAN